MIYRQGNTYNILKSGLQNTLGAVVAATLLFSCAGKKEAKGPVLFEALDSKRTGIEFSNTLTYNKEFNLFKYIYFYNGSGLGAGDFNNDGLTDLFFGSNQSNNRLYLNSGNLQFRDVTTEAAIPADGGWTTGVSVVDINNDGLLDIYVCRVGEYETLKSKNLLLVNKGIGKNGVPVFADEAEKYGLNFSGFSTQAAFLDYDLDGDLDMFLLNHSVHQNGTFKPRNEFIGTYHPLSGDRFYRNDIGKFTDVTKETGINSTAIGYGLGVVVADINLDGYPDIYVGNDFHEDDYLYINQQNGTFKEDGRNELMHTSQFSMGVDVADVNNDAWPEIISMDMLPEDPYILKRSLGEDAYDIFNYKVSVGYSHQYTRNNLQYNRGNGMFSETGLYSGVAATDWSWAPLWVDFDNDGLKDLFVSNGIPKRMNDIDYINFISNAEIQQRINTNTMEGKNMALINKFPEIKLPNKFYHNNGNLSFSDEADGIKNSQLTFSNGAVSADLDNDGDPDIVVNNIDASAIIYENKTAVKDDHSSVRLKLKGDSLNINAVGARLIIYTGNTIRTYEKYPVKGFMSGMEEPLLAGIKNTKIDSAFLVWPDNSFQRLAIDPAKPELTLTYQKGLSQFDYTRLRNFYKNTTNVVSDITELSGLDYRHTENRFVEFDREPLIPHMVSVESPSIAVADINHDGLDDLFIGGARNSKPVIYIQNAGGKLNRLPQPALEADSSYENTDAVWVDVNNDTHADLVVASGGNEFYGPEPHNSPRVYINDGKGLLTRKEDAFDSLFLTASCISASDFNKDGKMDLFIGGRAVPWEYGKVPRSYLLQNDGTGKFTDVTEVIAPGLSTAGFITHALWFDLDKDGDNDLLLAQEWGSPTAYLAENGKFIKKELFGGKGWWNFLLPFDIDNDGDIDLVAGNLGLNSRLKASAKEPVRLYYNDYDGNGKKEQVLTYYLAGKELPFANKAELERQMPFLKKKYLYAEDFAKANLADLFGSDKLKQAAVFTADYFSNTVLINDGKLKFNAMAFPFEAQLTSLRDAVVINANNDNLPDLLVMGNYYGNNIEMGRYDADYGTVLVNKGKGEFSAEKMNGLAIKGEVRHIRRISLQGKEAYIFVCNNEKARVIRVDAAVK
ncbi:MAG: VCBS repeat-containing protein [Chitinophagaceae bacterium]|nr:VCBS repeat-containing protein [Chitinophagaceae bacterium]